MKTRVALVTGAITLAAFAGTVVWPTPPEVLAIMPTPTPPQLALLMVIKLAEALALGLGVSFLLFGGYSGDRAIRLSIFWLMANWWLHTNLHSKLPPNLNTIIAIEYAFHGTLLAAGAFLAFTYVQSVRERRAVAL
jgi:hypothetical protein